jgi:hypothetical protein
VIIEFKQLDEQQKQAISYYSKGAFNPINSGLRENRFPQWDVLGTEQTKKSLMIYFLAFKQKKATLLLFTEGLVMILLIIIPNLK